MTELYARELAPAPGAVEEAFAAMARNHDVAVDKVVHRVDVDVRRGDAIVLPAAPAAGLYVVKVLTHGTDSAAGSVFVDVRP